MITAYARVALAVDFTDIPARDRTVDSFEHVTLSGEGTTCAEYSTTVPLWPTGADAARHGSAAINDPDDRARATIAKLEKSRWLGNPDG